MASLTYQQFEDCALHLATIANKIGDGWELKRVQVCSEPEKVFLMKRTHYFITEESLSIESSESVDDKDILTLTDDMEEEEETDPGVATLPRYDTGNVSSSVHQVSQQRTVHLEYHIVYSQSYEVPILYFNATYTNGRQLILEDIWKLISKQLTSSETVKWSLVTQQEHPLLHCPYYHIHPCHTAKVMATALSIQKGLYISDNVKSDNKVNLQPNKYVCLGLDVGQTDMNPSHGTRIQSNYLVSWLSTFGPLIGIKVPVQYIRTSTVEE